MQILLQHRFVEYRKTINISNAVLLAKSNKKGDKNECKDKISQITAGNINEYGNTLKMRRSKVEIII